MLSWRYFSHNDKLLWENLIYYTIMLVVLVSKPIDAEVIMAEQQTAGILATARDDDVYSTL